MTDNSVVTDDGMISVNCGRCGKPLWVPLASLASRRTYDCSECQSAAAHADNGTDTALRIDRKTHKTGQGEPS